MALGELSAQLPEALCVHGRARHRACLLPSTLSGSSHDARVGRWLVDRHSELSPAWLESSDASTARTLLIEARSTMLVGVPTGYRSLLGAAPVVRSDSRESLVSGCA